MPIPEVVLSGVSCKSINSYAERRTKHILFLQWKVRILIQLPETCVIKKQSFCDWYWEHVSISLFIQSATDKIHKIMIETVVLPDHSQKMSENTITSDGLLNAPGTSNAFENEDKMEVSYDITNEDDLLGKSDDDEQNPPCQVPRKPKQPKQQRQSRDRHPQRSTSEPRTEQYRKRHRHSPSTENRKRSRSLSAEDKISQAEGVIKALKRHTDRGTCPETLQYRARAKITPDEDFKRETKQIRKNAEQETLNAIIQFRQWEIGHFKAETKKGKRAAPAIALNTKNCSTIEPARTAKAENNVYDRNSKANCC